MQHTQEVVSSRTTYKLVVHRLCTHVKVDSLSAVEPIIKQFNVVETKTKSGRKYRVVVFRESKGESVSVYEYTNGNIIATVNTHKLARRQHTADLILKFGFEVVRDYAELYARVNPRYETVVNTAVLAYAEVKGLGYSSQTASREWERLVFNTRTDKHEISNGLMGVLKLYRDKQLKEDPKLEIEFWTRNRLLAEGDIQLAGRILNTILKLTKARIVYNDYDKHQDSVVVEDYDRVLHRQLFATVKRLGLSIILMKDYRDKRLAIAELLDRGLKPADIAKLTGYHRVHVHRIIDQLLDMGVLERIGRGKYRLKSRRVREELQHPLPLHVIVNLEYEKVTVVPVPYRQWDRDLIILKYTREGWCLHPQYRPSFDGVVVFNRGDRYLLVKRVL